MHKVVGKGDRTCVRINITRKYGSDVKINLFLLTNVFVTFYLLFLLLCMRTWPSALSSLTKDTCSARGNHLKLVCIQNFLCWGGNWEKENCSLFTEGLPDLLLSSFISPIFDDFGSAPSHSSELGSVNRSAATNIPER